MYVTYVPALTLNGLVRRCWLSRHALRIDTARDSPSRLLIWKEAQKKNGRRKSFSKTQDSWEASGGDEQDHTHLPSAMMMSHLSIHPQQSKDTLKHSYIIGIDVIVY